MTIYFTIAVALLLVGFKLYRQKQNKSRIVHIIDANCTRCRSCIKRCNHKVLSMVNDGNDYHVQVTNPDRCTGCGHCEEVCHFNAIQMIKRLEGQTA